MAASADWGAPPRSPTRGLCCRRLLSTALASELGGTAVIIGGAVSLLFVRPQFSFVILERDPSASYPLVSPPTVSVPLLVVLGAVVPGLVIGATLSAAAVMQRAGFKVLLRAGFAHVLALLQAW